MVTSIAILVGLALFCFLMFFILIVAGIMLLRGKKSPAKKKDNADWHPVFEGKPERSFREQINIEKAEAVAKLYSDLTEKQFIDDTIAEAKKLFETA